LSENTVLSLVQTFHNFAGVLFTAGPVYFFVIFKRQGLPENFDYRVARSTYRIFSMMPLLWMFLLILQVVTGGGFGFVSLIFQGLLPTISPIATLALLVKVLSVVVSFIIAFYLWWFVLPELKAIHNRVGCKGKPESEDLDSIAFLHQKIVKWLSFLSILSLAILTGAAFLRWNM